MISEKNFLDKTTTFSYEYLTGGGIRKRINYEQGVDELIEYNAFGWVLKHGTLGINNKWTYTSFRYDIAGRKVSESEPYFTSPSQWNTIAFDSYGREITRTSFNGLVANIVYSGLVTTIDDGTKIVKTTKNGNGNTIKMEDLGGSITYTYYGNGVMKSANYGSHIVSTQIDGWGRKKTLTDPSAGTYTYKYDNLGQILKETTPKGYTEYEYDSFGKIKKKIVKGDYTDLLLNYQYDESDDKLLDKIYGKNNITNENYTYDYIYDTQKRPYITRESNGKAFFEHQLGRDTYGRVSNEVFISTNKSNNQSSIVRVKNIYESSSGILTEVLDGNTNASLWKIKEVNARGQAKEVLLGNGMVKKRTYDQFGFLKKILDQTSGSSNKTALNLEYSFNTQRGNLNNRKNNNLGWNEDFTYDNLDRLTNISGSVTRSQQYDGRGRITTNSEIGNYNYTNGSSYLLKSVDLNTKGDLYYQNQPVQNVKYNSYKKPVSISVNNKAKVDFEYGVLQSRSHAYYGGKEENKINRRYQKHYSAIAPIEIEEDNQGNTKFITYIGGDAYVAPIVHIKQTKTGASSGFHYLHRDYLGSILAITDGNTVVKEQRQFGAWGEVDKFKSLNSEIDFEYGSTLLNRGYTGHEHFVGVALIHMNGRMYDAKLGRFLSPDNYIQEPFSTKSFNRFGYVWNNPLKYNDPSGELIWFVVAAAVFAVGNTVAHAIRGDINSFWDGLKYFVQGAITGAAVGVGLVYLSSVPVVGSIVKIGAGIKAVTTVTSLVSGLGHGIFTGDWSRLGNAAEILVGNFYLDENKSFFGGIFEGVSRYTWQSLQNTVGFSFTQFKNTIGKVDRVDFLGGATFATNENANSGNGISIGNYINIDLRGEITGDFTSYVLSDDLFMHEYGHYVQSQIFGLSYLFAVGIPSLISASSPRQIIGEPTGVTTHDFRRYEMQANRYAARYFGRHYNVNWTNLETQRPRERR